MNRRSVLIGGIILAVLFITLGMWFFLFVRKEVTPSGANYTGISGIFDVNGVVPAGSTITLFYKEARSTSSFLPFASQITVKDQGLWNFPSAASGKSYEIQGGIVQNGTVLYLTSPIDVSAPAINQVLTFDIPSKNPAGSATISGTVGINGYIPPGATLTLEGRKVGTRKFSIVTQNVPARDQQFISYTSAVSGQEYEVKALLFDGAGSLIGESGILVVVAPAANEMLNLNSVAQPPATPTPLPTATPLPTQPAATTAPTSTPLPTPTPVVSGNISGTIQFNGQAPANTRIVVFQRVSGTQNFQVAVDNITPQNGTSWQWSNATVGTSYDLIAILKQRQNDGADMDISNSNTITVTAPAAMEVFTINSGYLLPSPGSNITVSCNNYNSSNQIWTVGISFPSMTGAQSYWYQVGTTNGGVDLTNFTQNATNNPTQAFTLPFKNGVTYYARYVYANVPNLMGNDPQFSPFSSSAQLQCSN